MGGPFLVKSLWSKLWSCAKRGCRNPGREALKLFGAGMCRPGKRGLPLRNKCSWYRISYTISYPISYTIFNTLSSISNTRMTYDIGYDKLQLELRYRSFFSPISKYVNFDIGDLRYRTSISKFMDFDIEGLRYRSPFLSSISKYFSTIS